MKQCRDIVENVQECWDEGWCSGCEKWEESCCDWAPCSWFCDLIVRGACLLCTWVENIVCTIYEVVVGVLCVVIDIATLILGAIVAVIEGALNWAWSIVGFIWGILTSIPGLGRLLSWLHGLATAIIYGVASIPDAILGFLGVMPEKKLRLGIIVLKSADGRFTVSEALLLRAVQCAINVFKEELNVRVIPIRYTQYQHSWMDTEKASNDYLFHDDAASSDRLLDVCCKLCAAGQDLGSVGADFNFKMARHTFWGNSRRLLGYGAPVVAFTVRSVEGSLGCSLGPLSDWVTVEFIDTNTDIPDHALTSDDELGHGEGSIATLTHEVAHACNLWHVDDRSNLMHTPPPRRSHLDVWQKVLIRSSRHVTYL